MAPAEANTPEVMNDWKRQMLLAFYVACALCVNNFESTHSLSRGAWWAFVLMMNAHVVELCVKLSVLREARELPLARHFILTMAFGALHWGPIEEGQQQEKKQ